MKNFILRAGMAELADVQDLGSCAARRVGSTPTARIGKSTVFTVLFLLLLFQLQLHRQSFLCLLRFRINSLKHGIDFVQTAEKI